MGLILADQILTRAQQTLLEANPQTDAATAGLYWPRTTLFDNLNEAMEQISGSRFDAYVLSGPYLLAAGTKQFIPPNATLLKQTIYNLGLHGDTPGPVITPVDLNTMNRISLHWRTDPASFNTRHYMYDLRNPRRFDVWPPVPAQGTWVEMENPTVTPTMTDPSQPIPLEDTWETAIYYFILARAFAKNTPAGDATKMTMYWNLFLAELGMEAAGRLAEQPGDQKQT